MPVGGGVIFIRDEKSTQDGERLSPVQFSSFDEGA
jgi:hypothetical protein